MAAAAEAAQQERLAAAQDARDVPTAALAHSWRAAFPPAKAGAGLTVLPKTQPD
jgi:hypothetical protein